ncbi:Hypothetical predicted protein [Olea europaea subsp. europaea]|uniref:Uncharacterized protein n=1 Tax=Olea europaea subsp. europaea TaxID=158383 RepID=A0A8S0UW38_OLEEU|nr:Hypothetical predicted protein [Olea europaea subsp. europaea]
MANTMEQPPFGSRRHDESEFNLKEWGLKARISRENTSSRRFSASYIRSFREDARSFRSNITISSTASSPGYTLKDEIDPSTYSFTTALKALKAKTVYTWEYLSPDGFVLNSKWNEAEKYISNPLSGEVPLECLSAKTLSGRSVRSLTSRITMSAPLIYPNHLQQFDTKSPIAEHENEVQIPNQEDNKINTTRDKGTQSTPADLSSGSPSPARTPSIEERSIKRSEAEGEDSSISSEKLKPEKEVEVKETKEREDTKINELGERKKICMQGGCLSLRNLWMRRRQKKKQKSRNKNTFLYLLNAC